MRVIIRAAGDGTRWGNYRGVPKHLAPICGEPVLHRTVRLVGEIAPDADVRVVVADLTDDRTKIPGSRRWTDQPLHSVADVDKLASAHPLWSRTDRTVTLWGDTWYSRAALTSLLGAEIDQWHVWLRFGTGGVGGEVFGFAWEPEAHDDVLASAQRIADATADGSLAATARGGWSLYRALAGAPLDDHRDHGNSTLVDDWTEDFDEPADWDRWCLRYARTPARERVELVR